MTNNQYINAYKKTQQSSNAVTTSHEIVRTLMKELVNSMQKIVLDIQDERKTKQYKQQLALSDYLIDLLRLEIKKTELIKQLEA